MAQFEEIIKNFNQLQLNRAKALKCLVNHLDDRQDNEALRLLGEFLNHELIISSARADVLGHTTTKSKLN